MLLQAAGPAARPLWNAPLLPEGSAPRAPEAMVLDGPAHYVELDLDRATVPRALVLQADADDVYLVEASADGARWTPLWRVPPVRGVNGLRTRATVLEEPAAIRHLRLRVTWPRGVAAVSSLRAHDAVPSPWPPLLDYRRPGSRLPVNRLLAPEAEGPAREAVAVLALLAVGWSALAWRFPRLESRRWRRPLLGAAALLAVLAWTNFLNFRHPLFVHHWELFHYYVGAKYFDELRYTRLYDCAVAAEAEGADPAAIGARRIRDLRTNRLVFAREAVEQAEACRARFTPARWASFRTDLATFAFAMGAEQWANSQQDHGFNATPVWTLGGLAIASVVPARPGNLALLATLDLVLLAAGFLLVLRTFGFEAACVAAIYFGLNGLARFTWTGGAFLRYDWLFAAVAGVSALKAGRPFLGGAALAWSALLRVFPGCLLAGLAAGAVARAVTARSMRPFRDVAAVAAGAGVATALLGGLSAAAFGPGVWGEFRVNSAKYLSTQAENFVGAPVLLAFRPSLRQELTVDPTRPDAYEDWAAGQAEATRTTRPLALGLAAAFVVLLAVAAARHEPWAGAVLGAGLLPIALKMANYYYGLLAVYAMLWAVTPLSGAALAGLAWATNLAADAWPAYDERSVAASALVCAFAVVVTLLLARTPSAAASASVAAETASPADTAAGR